jgi:putative ABC transport system permease protein
VSIAGSATLSETGVPAERYRLARTTSGLFREFRVDPILGRGLQQSDDEPGAPGALVLGYSVWKNRYNRSSDVIGRAVRVNEQPATIVGVMPEGLQIPNREDLWTAYNPAAKERDDRGNRPLMVIGLLKSSATIASASTDLSLIAQRLEQAYPDTNKEMTTLVQTFNDRFNGDQVRTVFLLMLGAVGFVLLITCANVANMLLGRAIARDREMSIRAALGASRWQIVRQLLIESVVLSFAGGTAGLGLAYFGIGAFDGATQDVGKPSWIIFAMDYTVLLYFIAICVAAGVVFGLAPALRSSRVDLNHVLKDGGRGGSGRGGRLSGALVVAQFTLAVVLLAGAGLLMRSFIARSMINHSMPREQIITARVGLPSARYADKDARFRFFENIQTRLRALPGVTHATIASYAPGLGAEFRRVEFEGRLLEKPQDRASVATVVVAPTFFSTFDLPIAHGRGFDDRDGLDGREAVVVTKQFATTYWPNQEAVGQRFRFNSENTPGPWMTVVGLSGDLLQSSDQTVAESVAFVPYRQEDQSGFTLIARTTGEATRLGAVVRGEVQAVDLDLALGDVGTLESRLARSRWMYVVFGTLFVIFAGTALLMAGIGLYGVMAQATSRRTREIGIRVALGATPGRILSTVMRRGVLQLMLGLALGLGAAFGVTRLMSTLLFGVGPRDPIVFAAVSVILLAVGLLSCWLPARRAATIAPLIALTQDGKQ